MTDIRQTPLITTFPGADEDPLYQSGAWAPIAYYDLTLQLKNHEATGEDHPTALSGYFMFSYYTRLTVDPGGEWEVWACVAGGQLGAALETWRLSVWGGPYDANGYTFLFGGGLSKDYYLRSYLGGRSSFSDLDAVGGGGGYPNMMLLRRTKDARIEGWSSFDNGANWDLRVSAPDSTPWGGPLYMAIGIEDPTGGGLGFGCFGGGVPHRTQIYRILKALS